MPWSAIVKLMAGVGLPILAMFSAWIGITRYGASEREAGRLYQLTADELVWGKAVQKRAKEREADDARQLVAWQGYSTRSDLLRAAEGQSHDKVAIYAQTDAGRAPCLDRERVRDIDATAAALGLLAPTAAVSRNIIVQPNIAAGPGPK